MKRLLLVLLILGCSHTRNETPVVAASTSLIGTILKELGRDRIEVITIVPAGICPGHFDVKPKDIAGLGRAQLFFCHGFEGWVEKINTSVGKGRLKRITVDVKGSWMVPGIHKEATLKIFLHLCQILPEDKEYLERNLRSYEQRIDSVLSDIDPTVFKGIPVVSAEYQSQFLRWLGFQVVETYGRPEEFNPAQLKRIISKAKENNVILVVDNLQSGSDAGQPIAEETDAKHIVLTNFPIGESYPEVLIKNIEKLKKAIGDRSRHH